MQLTLLLLSPRWTSEGQHLKGRLFISNWLGISIEGCVFTVQLQDEYRRADEGVGGRGIKVPNTNSC